MDPDRGFADRLARHFTARKWRVEACDLESPEAAASRCCGVFSCIAVDICPAGRPRFDLLSALREGEPRARIVALAAFPSVSVAVKALHLGASDFIGKPVSAQELALAIDGSGPDMDAELKLPSLGRIESDYIFRILTHTNYNISSSARILGIRRSTLQRKLKKYPPVR